MVVSVNSKPSKNEFEQLLKATIQELNAHALKSPKAIEKLRGTKLESYVGDVMTNLAIGSKFENSIEVIGGQKFPDIIANKFYGIEVKTTTQNHWKTTGNSVMESTRVEDVERIYVLFGKLASPIEFRCRPYEACLSEVVVTHSPRYLIDMNLEDGKTIFDKMNISYDDLRAQKNTIKPIINYYKSKLKPGQDLWWIDQENGKATNFVINIWNNLSTNEQEHFVNKAMVLFPEIFGSRPDKYSRFAIWLVKNEGVVCPNVRDAFTAKGRAQILLKGKLYKDVPRILINLFEHIDAIIEELTNTSSIELSELWRFDTKEETKITDWMILISTYSKSIRGAKHLNVKQMLMESMC